MNRSQAYECPTIASEEAYSDWLNAVDFELVAARIDVTEARESDYGFRASYCDYGMTPRQAVEDYQVWRQDNV